MRVPIRVSLFDMPDADEIQYLIMESVRSKLPDATDDDALIHKALSLASCFQARADMVRAEVEKFRRELRAKEQGKLGLVTAQESKRPSVLRRIKREL